MNYAINRITLDVQNRGSSVSVNAKKGDTARKLVITLTDGGMPYKLTGDCYAVFTGEKPDNHIVFNECQIEDNRIVYHIRYQTVAAEGTVKCEVRIYGADDLLLTSARFSLIVESSVYEEGGEIESSDDFSVLTDLISQNQELMRELEELINSGGGSGGGGGGTPGKDGFSPIATVTQSADGATISITDAKGTTTAKISNGKDGADGKDGKDGANGAPGKDGADGKTPIKGQDYFTEADKQEIIEEVLEQIPEGGGGNGTVTSVNGVHPDESGNVQIDVGVTVEEVLEAMPTVSAIDFSNFENGSFTETVDGETITHDVTFDDSGRPVSIDDVTIGWGNV